MHSSPGPYPGQGGGGGYPPQPPPYAATPAAPPPGYPPQGGPPYPTGGPAGPGGGGPGRYGAPRPRKPPYSGLRGAVAGISLVLAVVLSIPALSALWLRWEVVSSEGFTENAVDLIDKPAIRQEVARLMADEIRAQLPSEVSGAATETLIASAMEATVAQPEFKPIWKEGVSTAHDVVMSSLLGRDGRNVTTDGDAVEVNLKTPLDTVVERLKAAGVPVTAEGLPTSIRIDLAQLPQASEARQGRDALRAIDDAGRWLPILALLLLVVGIAVAVNRWRALVMTGVGLILTSGLLLLLVSGLRGPVADELAARDTLSRDGVEAVYSVFTGSLVTMSWSVFAAAIVAVVVGATGLTLRSRRR